MAYLLIGRTGTLRRTRWLTAEHFRAARRGDLVIVDMTRGTRFGPGDWRDIPARRGEPLVMLAPRDEADDGGF